VFLPDSLRQLPVERHTRLVAEIDSMHHYVAMESPDVWAALVALVLAVVSYSSMGIWRERRLKLAERRLESYERLWAVLREASQSEEAFEAPARRRVHKLMTDWYYEHGDGIHLTADGQQIYFNAKKNLVSKPESFFPATLPNHPKKKPVPTRDREQGKLCQDQLSLLRTQLKKDVKFYGRPYGIKPNEDGLEFLRACKINVDTFPWSSRPWYQTKWWTKPYQRMKQKLIAAKEPGYNSS
jgi:hypothetical protein